MPQLRWSCPVLMIPLLAGLAGSEVYNKSVCRGDSIKMFNSIHINESDTVVNLFKNGDKYGNIAMWTSNKNSIIQDNVVMDVDKNVWIINVHSIDEGHYVIQYDVRNETPSTIEVQLSVWAAPAMTCKPKINRKGNILTATLVGVDCGKPPVSAYLKECSEECSGVICEGKDLAKLQSGREAGTYHACIEGSALSCARSSDPSSDQCSAFKIEESQTEPGTGGSKTQSGTDGNKDDILSLVIGILFLQIIGPAFLLTSYICYKKYRFRNREGQRNQRNEDLLSRDTEFNRKQH